MPPLDQRRREIMVFADPETRKYVVVEEERLYSKYERSSSKS